MSKELSNLTRSKLSKLLENEIDMALKRRAMRIIEEVGPCRGDKILEAGCGNGYYLNLLGRLGIGTFLYGVDINESALKVARKVLKNRKIFKADLTKKLPFKENSFDKVILSEVIEHIHDEKGALSEVYRVLKPNGRLIVTVPNVNYPLFWDPVNKILELTVGKHIKNGFWAGIWSNHMRLYSLNAIKRVVHGAGFYIIKTEALTWWCLPFNHNLLYGGKLKLLSRGFAKSIRMGLRKENFLKSVVLRLINLNDKLNDIYKSRRVGVGILVVAQK